MSNCVRGLNSSKVMAGRNGDKINADRELISIGLANIINSFFHGYVVAGSLSKTSVSYQAGTRSQLSGLVAVGVLILVLLILTPFLYYVPVACLGAIILVAAYHLFEYKTIKKAFKLRKSEGWLIVLTLILTLLLGVEYGIIAGIIISFALFIWSTARPRIYSLGLVPGSETAYQETGVCPVETREDELIIKIDGPLYFANANYVEEQIINMLSAKPELKCLILDAQAMTDIDLSGEYVLWQILRIMLLRDADLSIVGVNKPVMDLITASGFYDFLGPECFFASIPEAIDAVRSTCQRSIDFLSNTQVMPAVD